jgi:hypothetical protein
VFATFAWAACAHGAFDLSISVSNPSAFTATQLGELESSIDYAKTLWESVITGYQPGINLPGMTVTVTAGSDFAEANYPQTTAQAGFTLSVFTSIRVNPTVIDNYASWTGTGVTNPNPAYLGLNYLNDIMAHEVGHALGIGLLWEENGVSIPATGQYTGAFGLAAYRAEFDPLASFVPVEQALSTAADVHWDQVMRSSPDEGNPSDPFSLSPLTGITDTFGRDLGLELMTGAIDADYGRPFLSHTTVQSLRDLGFTVVPEPAGFTLVFLAALSQATCNSRHLRLKR